MNVHVIMIKYYWYFKTGHKARTQNPWWCIKRKTLTKNQPWFYSLNLHRISSKSKPKVERNPEEGLNEDEDVQMEKARVKEALTCQSCEEVSEYLIFWSRKIRSCWILPQYSRSDMGCFISFWQVKVLIAQREAWETESAGFIFIRRTLLSTCTHK